MEYIGHREDCIELNLEMAPLAEDVVMTMVHLFISYGNVPNYRLYGVLFMKGRSEAKIFLTHLVYMFSGIHRC